nr:depupylase/deamidase Dop [Streptomyces albidoflavus]
MPAGWPPGCAAAGISVPGHPNANAMLTSSQIVNAYAAAMHRARRARWDFEEENPLRDARGFDLAREVADSSQLTDEDIGLANVILTNGARLYVDHAHPEYSSPEVTNPRDAVLWDKAGERIMAEAAERAAQLPGAQPIHLYKNNTDNKGASYGTHENYLMKRETPFSDIVRHLTPFFVSRQVVTGAGRVGIGQDGRENGFQISQRADYFEVEVGLETTLKRPIINTRDEPHADAEKYRRLHVIIGDANLSEISTYLKLGTTALVLSMIEDGFITVDLAVDQPVRTLHHVSHDPTLQYLVTLRSGRTLTAVQLQMEYFELARKYVDERYGADADEQTKDVLARWEDTLGRLENDPMTRAPGIDAVRMTHEFAHALYECGVTGLSVPRSTMERSHSSGATGAGWTDALSKLRSSAARTLTSRRCAPRLSRSWKSSAVSTLATPSGAAPSSKAAAAASS